MTDIGQILTELAACLCVELGDAEETCFCGVLPGAGVAMDYLGDCQTGESGCRMAWVRLATAYPSQTVGQADTTVGNCGKGLGFDVEMGVIRCMPVGDDSGNPPSPAAMADTFNKQIEDLLAMRRAVACCDVLTSKDYILGDYQPITGGGVTGGTWLIFVSKV